MARLNAERDGLEFWRRLVVDHRIVVRSCANFEGLNPQYFRVGVRTRNENLRLLIALASVDGSSSN
jgi:threonine-phosphate decarboxylase